MQRLQREPVVVGYRVGDERLDARVADVLQLLPVGRVHVGFVRVEARGAPTDFPDFGEVGGEGGVGVGTCGLEVGALLKWIGGEVGLERFEGEGLVAGGDVNCEIAPGAPPERLKGAVLAAVGQEFVAQARGGAACDGIAVGFVVVLVVERLGIGELDARALAAGDGELRVGGG